jgi:hypothetical protein
MFFSTANDVDSQIRNARNGCTIATLAHARALIGALSEQGCSVLNDHLGG